MEPIQNALIKYGMEYDKALSRFSNNESMLLMFVREFPDEPYLADIVEAHGRGDAAAYAAAVHSLKGISVSLGFVPLFNACTALMAALRADDAENAERLYPEVVEQHERVCELVRSLG